MSKDGRYFYVTEDGRKFCIEPIDANAGRGSKWGDIDPASKTVTGSYGQKHPGAVHPDESIITKENGFKNIVTLPPGVSPEGYIKELLAAGK